MKKCYENARQEFETKELINDTKINQYFRYGAVTSTPCQKLGKKSITPPP